MLEHQFIAAWRASRSVKEKLDLYEEAAARGANAGCALNLAVAEGLGGLVEHILVHEESRAGPADLSEFSWGTAMAAQDLGILRMLIEHGGAPPPVNVSSALQRMMRGQEHPVPRVDELLDLGLAYDMPRHLIEMAARAGHPRILEKAVRAIRTSRRLAAAPYSLPPNSDLLHRVIGASATGDPDLVRTVRLLLELGVDPDACTGREPVLAVAAARGRVDVVRALLEGAERAQGGRVRADPRIHGPRAALLAEQNRAKHPDRGEYAEILALLQ